MKKNIILFCIVFFMIFYSSNTAFAWMSDTEEETSNKGNRTSASATIKEQEGTISGVFEVAIDGHTTNAVSENKANSNSGSGSGSGSGSSGSGGTKLENCFVWRDVGNATQVRNSWDAVFMNMDNRGTEHQMIDVVIEAMQLSVNGRTYVFPVIQGEAQLPRHTDLIDGKLTIEEQDRMDTVRVYAIIPNLNIREEFLPNGRCGHQDVYQGTLIFTEKHIADDDSPQSYERIAQSVANGDVSLKMEETSSGTYKATIEYGSFGAQPSSINNIYYVWTVRVPDKNDPLVKTVRLNTLTSPSNLPNTINIPFKSSGNTNGFDANLLKQRLNVAFNNLDGNSNLNGNTYVKNAKATLYRPTTVQRLKGVLNAEPSVANAINGDYTEEFQIGKYEITKNLTSTYSLPSSVQNLNGKAIVTVSAIVDGNYTVATGNGGTYTFSFPLGYVSTMDTQFASDCAVLADEVAKLLGKDFNEMTLQEQQQAQSLVNSECEIEEWEDGAAIARVSATQTGEAQLDGSLSRPPRSRTIMYTYNLDQQTITCEVDENGDKIDPNCETKIIYNNLQEQKLYESPWETYSITGYYWYPRHRVKQESSNKYEIHFDGKPHFGPNAVQYATLYRANTYACLGITTSAGRSYGAMNTNISGVSNISTHQKTDINFGRNNMNPLHYATSLNYCDSIIVDEQNRRIIENWGN